jgi:hypothetical protein
MNCKWGHPRYNIRELKMNRGWGGGGDQSKRLISKAPLESFPYGGHSCTVGSEAPSNGLPGFGSCPPSIRAGFPTPVKRKMLRMPICPGKLLKTCAGRKGIVYKIMKIKELFCRLGNIR